MNKKLICLGILSVFLLTLISTSAIGINTEINEKQDIASLDEVYVEITKPQIGYIYKNNEPWLFITDGRATVIGHCDIEVEYSDNVVMEKTKYYIDDKEVDLEDWVIQNGEHRYKVEVFDEEDNSESDYVPVRGLGTRTKSAYSHNILNLFIKIVRSFKL